MRRPRFSRESLPLVLAVWAGSAGCIQNYYPAAPICGPAAVVPNGALCEVPTANGTIVTQAPPGTTIITTPPPRVVVSEPSPRFSWRRSDPDGLATTRVEGNLNEPPLQR